MGNRSRVGHSGRLDDDTVELHAVIHFLEELVEHDSQVLTYRAAEAPIHHFDNSFLGLELSILGNQLLVDARLSVFRLCNKTSYVFLRSFSTYSFTCEKKRSERLRSRNRHVNCLKPYVRTPLKFG